MKAADESLDFENEAYYPDDFNFQTGMFRRKSHHNSWIYRSLFMGYSIPYGPPNQQLITGGGGVAEFFGDNDEEEDDTIHHRSGTATAK